MNKPKLLGMSQEAFLKRVTGALGRSVIKKPATLSPLVDESIARLATADQDLFALFTEKAVEVGMFVHQTDEQHWADVLASLLNEHQVKKVTLGLADAAQSQVEEIVTNQGMTLIDWVATKGLKAQFDADAGITDVHGALAETGTLICHSDETHSRGPSLVVPLHFAIVRRQDIYPDMIDYWKVFEDQQGKLMPSSIAFITGPSKTADIEGVLVTGVHGPGQVHIVLIDD